MSQQVIILDTTLRDGEQSLKASLSVEEKLKIAFALEKMGIDIIEAGFPISSPGDFKSVHTIAKNIKNSQICSLARCVKKDIDAAVKAMSVSAQFRIHIFLGTSTLHIESKLRKNFKDILDMAIYFVKYARNFTDNVEFSCEDAGRTPISNLCKIVEETIKAGATTINIPDTVGYTIPYQFSKIIKQLYNKVPNIDKSIISVHCHNDLGMAVANSISALQSGARQIEGTINGIGERAGNTALEELVVAIKIKKDILNLKTNINYQEIYNTSKIISEICNMPISANKAIVGSNAFAHSSGIHQDGVLKNRENYEIFTPSLIGLKEVKLNLTSRSGRAAVKHYMREMGYQDNQYDLDVLYTNFLKLADKKGQLFDYDLEALAFVKDCERLFKYYKLKNFTIKTELNNKTIIKIELYCGNKININTINTVNEPIISIYQLFLQFTNYSMILKNLKINTIIKKLDVLNQTNVAIQYNNKLFYANSLEKNIFLSFINAIIEIINNIFQYKKIQNIKF